MKDEGYPPEVLNRVMLRQLLTLVVSLPMLMPPGMCVCQFVAYGDAATEHRETSSDTAVSVPVFCKCSTHQHVTDLVSTDEPAATSSPGQFPHEHDPSCPALLGTTPNKVAPTQLVGPHSFDVVVSYFWIQVQAVSCQAQPDEVLVQGSPPPLFLAHCAFLL